MSEIHTRVLVSLVLIPLALFALYYGGLPLVLAMYSVASIGSLEYLLMMRKAGIRISFLWVYLCSISYLSFVYIPGFDLPIIWLMMLVMFVEALFQWDIKTSIPKLFATLFGLAYTALLPALIVRIGFNYASEKILLALILMIWFVDTIAYFIGMKFGRKRNVTPVSPRKSVEGFIAGVVAPWLIVIILSLIKVRFLPFGHLALLAIAAGIFGQLGDLVESMLKRFCEVKDSSNLIPGHGGILDRSDSILFAGSFLYCALEIINKVR